jgi:hypothetical protein
MKKTLLISLLTLSTILLASCGTQAPLTEAEQAEKYNMSVTEFKEMKDAAARMNMTIDEHMKMTDTEHENMDNMDMSDDSHMIEDDMDMDMETKDDSKAHMEEFHKGQSIPNHTSDEHM